MSQPTQQYAPGHDNAADLLAFNLLNPPLFVRYTVEIDQKWKSYDGTRLTGARTDKTWGLPSVILTFGRLSREEFAYLVTLKGYCTLRCMNEDTNAASNFNATLLTVTAGSFNRVLDDFGQVAAEFIDLQVLA